MSAALHLHCLDTLTSPARQPGSQRTLALKATLSSTEVKGPSQISLSWPATCSSPLGPHAGMRGTWKSFSPSHFYLLLVLKHQPSALPRQWRRTLPDHMLGWGQHPARPVTIILPCPSASSRTLNCHTSASQDSSSRFTTDGTCLSPNLREAQKAAPSTGPTYGS